MNVTLEVIDDVAVAATVEDEGWSLRLDRFANSATWSSSSGAPLRAEKIRQLHIGQMIRAGQYEIALHSARQLIEARRWRYRDDDAVLGISALARELDVSPAVLMTKAFGISIATAIRYVSKVAPA